MLKHNDIYDPIKRDDEMKLSEFTKYVDICDAQDGPTDESTVESIKRKFLLNHLLTDRRLLDSLWEKIEPMISKNAGLAQFTIDYNGAVSEFFFPWLVAIHTSPSMALEMSYGRGYDTMGRWRLAHHDEIEYFVKNDPTFVYNRERQMFVADLVSTARDARVYGTTSKVVDLGAGRMAWARWHNFTFHHTVQTILAFDKDPTIDPERLFLRDLDEYGIKYRKVDLMAALKDPECKDANLVILGGVASYFPEEMFEAGIVMPVCGLLRKGGAFFFDLQLDCPYYRRSVKIFDWPEMKLAETATAAIERVEKMRRKLWKAGMRFDAEYKLDTYNEYPTSVMVVLTKL